MKHLISLFYLLVLSVLLSGCGTAGFPRQSYSEKDQIKQLEAVFDKPEMIKDYYGMKNATEADKKSARDAIISGRIALIDLNYNQFVARFSVTKESLDFSAEVTELGLNVATTATGGAATKTILSAVASGVTGGKLAIDKNFFFEKTVPVLITAMNAQRKQALLPIMVGISNNTDNYQLTRALSDLDTYYFAGTFVGALQAIQADAGSKEVQAQKNLDSVRTNHFMADDAGNLLQSYWTPKVSGSVNTTAGSAAVVGAGTIFTKEIAVGDQIIVGGDFLHVSTIADDTHLTTTANFAAGNSAAPYKIYNSAHQNAIENWLNNNGLPSIAIQVLIDGDLFADARKKIIQDLKIKAAK